MPLISYYDRQHVQRMLKQQGDINRIFGQFCMSVSLELRKWTDTGNNNVWVRNSSVEKAVEIELLRLQERLRKNVESNQADSWEQSNKKNDYFLAYIQSLVVNQIVEQGMFSRNLEALSTLQKRVTNGMNLSDRVWNIVGQTKVQLEFYLQSGLSAGRPSALISQDVRQLLDNPDRRFHRIRNEKGILVPSEPMKKYHPGQGQYRSSKQNALRLAATETNIAYRMADHERWSKLDFILGINVRRSPSAKEPCKICDPMVGEYPRNFIFTGWHPFCICFATAIVPSPEELAHFSFTKELPEHKIVRGLPSSALRYIKDNLDSINKSQPYWLRDNFGGDAANALRL